MALKTNSRAVLFSSDRALEEGFDRVKQQHDDRHGCPSGQEEIEWR